VQQIIGQYFGTHILIKEYMLHYVLAYKKEGRKL